MCKSIKYGAYAAFRFFKLTGNSPSKAIMLTIQILCTGPIAYKGTYSLSRHVHCNFYSSTNIRKKYKKEKKSKPVASQMEGVGS